MAMTMNEGTFLGFDLEAERPTSADILARLTLKLYEEKSTDNNTPSNAPGKPETNYPTEIQLHSEGEMEYKTVDEPDDDEYIYCEACNLKWKDGNCPAHGSLEMVPNIEVPADGGNPLRAMETLPPYLEIGMSSIRGADKGVYTKAELKKGLMFGPYEGTIIHERNNSDYLWKIHREPNPYYIDASDPSVSNWMRYVNCARHRDEQNLSPVQYKGHMYYCTNRKILPYEELLVWYGEDYARKLGIDVENYHKPRYSAGQYKCIQHGLSFNNLQEFTWHVGTHKLPSPIAEKLLSENGRTGTLIAERNFFNPGFSGSNGETTWNKYLLPGSRPDYPGSFEKVKPYVCSICGKSFRVTMYLQRHMNTHTGQKPYRCCVCGKRFAQQANLSVHTRIHSGKKPYQCNVCGKSFTQSGNLKVHSNIHTGLRLYECAVCKKCFSQLGNLIRHQAVHTGRRDYWCGMCGKGFSQCENLKRHCRIHTGEKRYKCNTCGKVFTQQQNQRRHEKLSCCEKQEEEESQSA